MYKKINKIQTFKKKWTTSDTYNNKDESQMHRAKWKKLDLKGQICMHLFIWHSGKGKTMGMENRPLVASGWSWGRVGYRGAAGGILGSDGTVPYLDCQNKLYAKKKKKNECLEGGWIKNQNTKMNCIFTYQECLENVNIFSRIREEWIPKNKWARLTRRGLPWWHSG